MSDYPHELDQAGRCDSCAVALSPGDALVLAYRGGECLHTWQLCATCYEMLIAVIQEELAQGAPRGRLADRYGRQTPTGKGGAGWDRPRDERGRWRRR